MFYKQLLFTEIRNDSVGEKQPFTRFSIERKIGGEENTNPAVLSNTGRKTLFVNKEQLMKNQKRILLHGDVIKIDCNCPLPTSFTFLDQRDQRALDLNRYSEKVRKEFYFEKQIGAVGLNGEILLAHDVHTFERFAVKSVSSWKDSGEAKTRVQDVNTALREINIMLQLNHPNIVRLVKTVWDQQYAHLFTELMNMGDLFSIVSRSSLLEPEAKFVMFQICQGLKYLHDINIGHGDIKLENIFVKNCSGKLIYKIGDFGLSVLDENATKRDGTLLYTAPEIFQEGNPIVSIRKSDIWSLGVVAYACVSGEFPFTKNDTEQTML